MARFQDPKDGKFISEAEAKKRGIAPIEGIKFHEAVDRYFAEESKKSGLSEKEIAENLLSQEFMMVEFNEATGTACLKLHSFATSKELTEMNCEELYKEYSELREHFPPVSAGIEYHKTFLCSGGFEVAVDDPSDSHKKDMKNDIKELCAGIYFDYYRKGLDRILYVLADPLLTYGSAAAEIIFDREIEFEEFATKIPVSNGFVWDVRLVQEIKNSEWKSLKGIERLKIIDKAQCRLKPVIDSKSLEILFWLEDAKQKQVNVSEEIRESVGLPSTDKITDEDKKLLPWQVFWLSWNTRGTSLKGESIIRPVLEIARMVRKILNAVGKGFERWADRKYFFVCGTDKRPWNKQAIKNFLKYLELMVQNKWTGVPVPQGFDVKEIGGDIFEGTDLLNYLIGLICAGMNYPRDFLEYGRTYAGDKAWLAWQVKYGANQRQLRRDIEHQLFQKHLWCKYGRTYRKPKQNSNPVKTEIYIPKIIWNAEGRWQRKEEMETLQKWLNVANPIGAEFKLAVERRGAELLGFGEIEFPSFKEIRRQIKIAQKQEELMLEQQLAKRQAGGVSKKIAPTGKEQKPPPNVGETRKAKIKQRGMPSKSFGESLEESKSDIENAVRESLSHIALPSIPIEITIKSEPSKPTKLDVTVSSEPNEEVVKAKLTTEKEKQETEKEKRETVRKIREKID